MSAERLFSACRRSTSLVAYIPTDFGSAFSFVITFEQFIATDHLRVGSISDLHPGRISSFHVVTTVPVLGNDAFQIPLADQFKQSFAIRFDVIDKNQMILIVVFFAAAVLYGIVRARKS